MSLIANLSHKLNAKYRAMRRDQNIFDCYVEW